MTEIEWMNGTDPTLMIDALADNPTDRKLRLGSVAFAQRLSPEMFADDLVGRTLDGGERFADGSITDDEREVCWRAAATSAYVPLLVPVVSWITPTDLSKVSDYIADLAAGSVNREERAVQCSLLRCIFGNPFRPIILDPSWQTPSALGLTEAIYADRAFDHLPILADALEEAGCDNTDILAHCRGLGPHVRGCWVVDLVLGKT